MKEKTMNRLRIYAIRNGKEAECEFSLADEKRNYRNLIHNKPKTATKKLLS
jgi:hypothetical protein